MNSPHEPQTDLATVADRTVTEATATPPDDLPDNPRAYLAWLRDPARPTRRPRPRPVREMPTPAPRGPLEVRDPAYAEASEKLRRLPDLGGASIAAARERLGSAAGWVELVIDAAAHPVLPAAVPSGGDQLERDTPAAPSCRTCGTALDPDGGCFTCSQANTPDRITTPMETVR